MSKKTEPKKKPTTDGNRVSKNSAPDSNQSKLPSSKRKKLYQILSAVILLAVVFALIAVISLVWTNWQQRGLMLREANQALLSLDQRINNLSEQSAYLEASHSRFESLADELSDLHLRVDTQGRRMAELGSTTRSDWLLAEAVYLARLANQRLQTERSVKNSLALLENVDLILKELDAEDVLPVRRAVAQDITALRLVNDVDRQGIYLELQALATSIENLPLMDFSAQAASDAKATEESTISHSDGGFFHELQSLVRVTQRQNPIEPVLQPAEKALVKYNLHMMLEQAQIALLREEQVIFESSLSKADNYLSRYFQSSGNRQTIKDRLQVLREKSVQQQLPVINQTLDAFGILLVTRQQSLTGADGE